MRTYAWDWNSLYSFPPHEIIKSANAAICEVSVQLIVVVLLKLVMSKRWGFRQKESPLESSSAN